jgi:hypothetical protein
MRYTYVLLEQLNLETIYGAIYKTRSEIYSHEVDPKLESKL